MSTLRRQKTEGRIQRTEVYPLLSVLCCLSSVVLAVVTAGCAVSEKTPPIESRNSEFGIRNSVESGRPPADDDFELLEDELAEQMADVADPLEPWNRIMYHVNDVLYFWVVKPCAQVCEGVLPEPARIGIRNFFNNLGTPIRLANCLLQGKGDSADREFHRFVVNTTSGIMGFGDPARDKLGLEPVDEDLGQTLATYGLGNGFYVVWPLLGPSTLRDTVGFVGDQFLNPTRYVEPWEVSMGISAGKMTNEYSFRIGEYESFKSAALDPYVAMREVYIQYRDKQIQE